MAYDHDQNTHVNITILVVDDDPIILSVIPSMLKNPIYKDKSFGEITVMTAKDSSEAVSTLRGQCNNIDVVITDYHMPGLNGVQLKRRIDEEFGSLPVIVISADMSNEIEQETLSSGAMCFMRKPIRSNDLNIIWKHALNYKMNDGSKKIWKTRSTNNPHDGDSGALATKSKLKWTNSLNHLFLQAIQHIGPHKAVPKKILEYMNVRYLTRTHVASKLQKYRKFLKRIENETSSQMSRRAINTNFASSSYINPQHSYDYNTSLSSNNPFKSQLGYGLGQSSYMMNTNAGSLEPIPYMNRRPIYDLNQTRSDLLPMTKGPGFSNGMFPLKEKSRSIFGTSQVFQAPMFGQYGATSDVLGTNSNLSAGYMGSNYVGMRIGENGDLVGPGGVRVNGHGNDSLGENLGAMNWDFNNNNTSNHGSSTSRFSPALPSFLDNENQPHGNLIAQPNGVVPVLENPSIFNAHHGINQDFCDTINSHFDQNQHQGTMTGENLGVSTDNLPEMNAIFAAHPPEDISNWSVNNGNYNEETLNAVATDSEMYFPTHDLNITNQELGVADPMEFPLSFDLDWSDEDFMKYLLDHRMN